MKRHNVLYDQTKAKAFSSSCIVCTFEYGQLLSEYIQKDWNKTLNNCYKLLRSNGIIPENFFL